MRPETLPDLSSNQESKLDFKSTKRIQGNHIQNSIKIMRQEEIANAGKSTINAYNTSNLDRIGKELKKTRMGFGVRNEREELNELMRSTDSNILKKSTEK